jgi:hypothetical protein
VAGIPGLPWKSNVREEDHVPAPHETTVAPEVKLIHERREQTVPALSPDRAAKIAEGLTGSSFSGSAWRKIESGTNRATDDKVAIMSLIVGITPDELKAHGRTEAAAKLVRLAGQVASRSGTADASGSVVERQLAADITELTQLLMRLPPDVRANLLAMLRSMDAAALIRRNQEAKAPKED